MSIHRPTPPWDFFHDASISSLQSYELSRLNHSANLRRQITALLDQWVEDNSQALLARWVCEDRALLRPGRSVADQANSLPQAELPFDQLARPELLPRRQERLPKLAHRRQR